MALNVLSLCFCVSVISSQSSNKAHIMCPSLANFTSCCIKLTTRSFWY